MAVSIETGACDPFFAAEPFVILKPISSTKNFKLLVDSRCHLEGMSNHWFARKRGEENEWPLCELELPNVENLGMEP